MPQNTVVRQLAAAVFTLFLCAGFILNDSLSEFPVLQEYLSHHLLAFYGDAVGGQAEEDAEEELPETEDEEVADTDEELQETALPSESAEAWEHAFVDRLPFRTDLLELNGSTAARLGMQSYYSSQGIYITDDRQIVTAYPRTSTDYEYAQVTALKAFLDEHGIRLLYVNKPTKYLEDDDFADAFGVETYINRNADLLMERLREADVPVLDLRDEIREDGLDPADLFYRTDHHWNTRCGLWASGKIAEALNEHCGYSIDLSRLETKRFSARKWENCWLGEQGRKVSASYVGLDDFTRLVPFYRTHYTFYPSGKEPFEGTFADFIDETVYNSETDVYRNRSWHYSYSQYHVVNHDVENGKILLLGDSYDQMTVPFLSLGVHEIRPLVFRRTKEGYDLHKRILRDKVDTVVICYAELMIGAHDDPESANYRMFSFSELP